MLLRRICTVNPTPPHITYLILHIFARHPYFLEGYYPAGLGVFTIVFWHFPCCEVRLIKVKIYKITVLMVPQSTMTAMKNKNIPFPPRILTVSEVAQLLHVHPNTVRKWSDNGLLKAYRLGHRQDRRFRLQDIEKLFSSNPRSTA